MIKKIIVIVSIIMLSFIILSIISLLCYKIIFSQKKIESFEVNNINFKKHILIASQGSKFKNQLVENTINEFRDKKIYIKVVDVSLLDNIKSSNWNLIIIINAVESGKYHKSVDQFIQKNNLSNNKIILVATSGSGKFKVKGYSIDAISTASRMKNVDNIKNLIVDKINSILENN